MTEALPAPLRRRLAGLAALGTALLACPAAAAPAPRAAAGPSVGCPAVPPRPTVGGPPPPTDLGPRVRSRLRYAIFDRTPGVDQAAWVVVASDKADLCASFQHGGDARVLLDQVTLVVAPGEASGVALGLADVIGPGARRGAQDNTAAQDAAAGLVRRALARGQVRAGGSAVDLEAGHPRATRDLVRLAAGRGRPATPCPGLAAYLRAWIESSAAGRPPPPEPRHRAKGADAAVPGTR